MAGIGFELRRILSRDSYTATLQAYIYAGLISSGPWVLSILSVLLIGMLSIGVIAPEVLIVQFLVSVTYLMAASLTLTGGLQLIFTRFVSDRLFEDLEDIILPNLMGLLAINTIFFGLLGIGIAVWLFDGTNWYYRSLMVANFVTLCDLWLVVIFLSGMKAYNRILGIMAIGYALMVAAAHLLGGSGLNGLLTAFLFGHCVLLFAFLTEIVRDFPAPRFQEFGFLNRRKIYPSLFATGLLYYAGIWADKLLFWYNPDTSEHVIGPLRASTIYDIPIFLAYLTIMPGMAVFLVRIETDFAETYDKFYSAVRNGEALDHIYFLKDQMTLSIRQGILEIFKVQGLTVMLGFLWAPNVLDLIGISQVYVPLLYVDMVGVSVQVVLMAALNVFFYLDRRDTVLIVAAIFLVSNIVLTLVTQALGPVFFGYGFVGASVISTFAALVFLNRIVGALEYETFMLSR